MKTPCAHDSRLTTHDFLRRARRLGDHVHIDADTEVPAGFLIEGNLVVSGDLRLGPGTRVTGSVKTHGTLELAQGVVIEGSLVARRDLTVGSGAWVRGPIISEAALHLAGGMTVTSPPSRNGASWRWSPIPMGTSWRSGSRLQRPPTSRDRW